MRFLCLTLLMLVFIESLYEMDTSIEVINEKFNLEKLIQPSKSSVTHGLKFITFSTLNLLIISFPCHLLNDAFNNLSLMARPIPSLLGVAIITLSIPF